MASCRRLGQQELWVCRPARPGRAIPPRRRARARLSARRAVSDVGQGTLPQGVERQRCVDTYVKNLQYICDQAKGSDLLLAIEPVTTAAHKTPFVLSTMQQAAEVYRLVDRANLKLVYDTYHLRMEEAGSLSDLLDRFWPMIGHVQFGNAPTRNEPGARLTSISLSSVSTRRGTAAGSGSNTTRPRTPGRASPGSIAHGYRIERP
jgi:sugar phosphate isomerase/epimerase